MADSSKNSQEAAGGSTAVVGGSGGGDNGSREHDWLPPIANVGRIMKQILPPNAKVSKEAKETMQECVSEFISFVTGEASDKCHREKRKMVNGDDVCWALGALGFDDYAAPIGRYLQRFHEMEADHRAAGGTTRPGGRRDRGDDANLSNSDAGAPGNTCSTMKFY